MITKVFSIIFVLFGFYSNVELAKLEEAMPHARKVYAIGTKEYQYPSSLKEMQTICQNFVGAISDPEILNYFKFGLFPTNAVFRKDVLEALKIFIPGTLCNRVTANDTKLIPLLKEINTKREQLTFIRDNFARGFSAAVKPDSKITPSGISCWVNNFIKDHMDAFTGETRELVKNHLCGFKIMLRRYKPDEKCPWPTDKVKPEDIKNMEVNFINGVAIALNKYPPK